MIKNVLDESVTNEKYWCNY